MNGNQIVKALKNTVKTNAITWNIFIFFYNIYHKAVYIPSLFKKFKKEVPPFVCIQGSVEPTLKHPVSQLATVTQCLEDEYAYWCHEMRSPKRINRKQWEFVYILSALNACGCLKKGSKGLGFGCGQEQLPAVFVKHGCTVVATDQDMETASMQGWVQTDQHVNALEQINHTGIISYDTLIKNIRFRNVDMNLIPDDLTDFDFIWSSCAFEHLGSIEKGL